MAVPRTPDEQARYDFRMKNAHWLPLSIAIASRIRLTLKQKGISKEALSDLLSEDVSLIEEMLSGKLTLIWKR